MIFHWQFYVVRRGGYKILINACMAIIKFNPRGLRTKIGTINLAISILCNPN